MKVLFLTVIIAITLLTAANAQQHRRFSVQDRVAQLKDSLALSDSQATAVDSILTNAMNKAQSLDESGPDRREAMMQIMKDANTDIEKVLTDDQRVKFEKMQAERRAEMQQRMMNRRNPDNN